MFLHRFVELDEVLLLRQSSRLGTMVGSSLRLFFFKQAAENKVIRLMVGGGAKCVLEQPSGAGAARRHEDQKRDERTVKIGIVAERDASLDLVHQALDLVPVAPALSKVGKTEVRDRRLGSFLRELFVDDQCILELRRD